MKKKIFAVSDIHGHAQVLKDALAKAGFDPKNSDHLLVVCGDCFDRGTENRGVLEYLTSVANKIIIRGNHEDMLESAMENRMITYNDVRNGTDITLEDFFGAGCIDRSGRLNLFGREVMLKVLKRFLDGMVDYYETENYIFVHGWLPIEAVNDGYTVYPLWKISARSDWYSARFNGWNVAYKAGILHEKKTIVCGHRFARYGYVFDTGRSSNCDDIFRGDRVIAIDGATVISKQINVLVIEDEEIPHVKEHRMHLVPEMFEKIATEGKTVELRLYDEKRKSISSGDLIEFINENNGERARVRVTGAYLYKDFNELIQEFDAAELGFGGCTQDEILAALCRFYSVDKVLEKGAFAIRFHIE